MHPKLHSTVWEPLSHWDMASLKQHRFWGQVCMCELIWLCPYLDFLTHKQWIQIPKSNRSVVWGVSALGALRQPMGWSSYMKPTHCSAQAHLSSLPGHRSSRAAPWGVTRSRVLLRPHSQPCHPSGLGNGRPIRDIKPSGAHSNLNIKNF